MTAIDRASPEFREYLELYERAPLLELGMLADAERRRLHPDPAVTYIIDRNINYTNVCVADCAFCAFYRRPKDPGPRRTTSFSRKRTRCRSATSSSRC